MAKVVEVLGISLWTLLYLSLTASETADDKSVHDGQVDDVKPRRGSVNGATRITISGTGFATEALNLLDPESQNRVELVSQTRRFLCPIQNHGTDSRQIVCTTLAMPPDMYYVRVSVNGHRIPTSKHCPVTISKCIFTTTADISPVISHIEPRTSYPGEVFEIFDKIYKTGSSTSMPVRDCGEQKSRIPRVYISDTLCHLLIPENQDDDYGLDVDDLCLYSNSIKCLQKRCGQGYGFIRCQNVNPYVGNQNVSYISGDSYGRSLPERQILRVTAQDRIATIQTYADVQGLSPSTGSIAGGQRLTVHGRFFDQTDEPAQVKVGGAICEVKEVKETSITCRVPPKPEREASFAGNRGVLVEIFDNTTLEANTNYSSPTCLRETDELMWASDYYEDNATMNNYVSLMTGYFVPPHTNEYRFFVKSDDEANLYLSNTSDPDQKVLIARCSQTWASFYTDAEQRSERMQLLAGHEYYYEVYHGQRKSPGSVEVAVQMYRTLYTANMAGNVLNEIKSIQTSSKTTHQIVGVTLQNWETQTGRSDVQVVKVTAESAMARYHLRIFGVKTEPLPVLAPGSEVIAALKKLTALDSLNVTINTAIIHKGIEHEITFNDGGNLPELTVTPAMTSLGMIPVISSVTKTTQGIDSMNNYRLEVDGIASRPIHINASAIEVKVAITDMLSVKCPRGFGERPVGALLYRGFEKERTAAELGGTRTSEVPPFCGRHSLKNPVYLYHSNQSMPAYIYRKMCFAYLGKLRQTVNVRFSNGNAEQVDDHFDVDLTSDSGWRYTCLDIYSLIVSGRNIIRPKIYSVKIYKDKTEANIYIDELYFGKTDVVSALEYLEVTTGEVRQYPRPWISGDAEVTGNARDFNVTFLVNQCETQFPEFEISQALTDFASYTHPDWPGSAAVDIRLLQPPSEGIGGSYDVRLGDHLLENIPAGADEETLKSMLETVKGVGTVMVNRKGTCAGYTWRIDHVIGGAGDQPDIRVVATRLTPASARVSVDTVQDGGVFFNPIPGDMLKTYHMKPQVEVIINGIPSKCSGDCGYEWSLEATPTITAVSPETGPATAPLTITGDGFVNGNTTVTIGGAECDVMAVTSNQILCRIGSDQCSMETQQVAVHVGNKGYAQHVVGSFTFRCPFSVTGFSPLLGSPAGGRLVTVTGSGFGDQAKIYIGGESCDVMSVEPTRIECIAPALLAGSYSVTVTDGTITERADGQFTSDPALSITVTQISTTSARVEGGTVLSIDGIGFGNEAPVGHVVTVDGKPATVTSWSDTIVVVVLPSLPPGSYRLVMTFPGGFADTSSIPEIVYTLLVTGVDPLQGSMAGGTILTVTGQGFSANPGFNSVSLGGVPCKVTTSSDTQIVCKTGSLGKTHNIDNSGTHYRYGRGFAWSKPVITIREGDTVKWTWNTSDLGDCITFRVEQTVNATAKDYVGNGFNSGRSTRSGVYSYTFTTAGIFYYWSGFLCDGDIYARGTIDVQRASNVAAAVSVMTANFEAHYDLIATSTPGHQGTCAPEPEAMIGCDEVPPGGTDNANFDFVYDACATPLIFSIEHLATTSQQPIHVSGKGLGTDTCQASVVIGGLNCPVITSSDTGITCALDHANMLEVGEWHEIDLVIYNRGHAIMKIPDDASRYVTILPHVSSVMPSRGSVLGGTRVTVNGGGFNSDSTVFIGGTTCTTQNLSFDVIICETAYMLPGEYEVLVKVRSHDSIVKSVCEGTCVFHYDQTISPTVTMVQPLIITSVGSIMTLTGENFGNTLEAVYVNIGETPCDVISVSDGIITCNAGSPVAGSQPLLVRIDSIGITSISNPVITVSAVFDSLSPDSGSIEGGTTLTLTGLGFPDGTLVQIGKKSCAISSISRTEIQCVTPSVSFADEVDVRVASNSVEYSPGKRFKYDLAATPLITALQPLTGSSGDTINIIGSGFGTLESDVSVNVGGVNCSVTSVTPTSVTCTVGAQAAGAYNIRVFVRTLGWASGSASFTYVLSLHNLSQNAGSYGGGQDLKLTGQGFNDTVTHVTICGEFCDIKGTPSLTELLCSTTAFSGAASQDVCDVTVTVGDFSATLSGAYTYDVTLSATITAVSPRRGTTEGGTDLTITGYGFRTDPSIVMVTIDGAECQIISMTTTDVTCRTGSHRRSVKTNVRMQIGDNGIADQKSADFEYINKWSSGFTWGGKPPPMEGDAVVIPKSETVLLDCDTPVLERLIVRGVLEFERKDVELKAKVILIEDGGHLQVGTEQDPFEHEAVITLYGHRYSMENYAFGTKVLAVRDGILDLHGKTAVPVWTTLYETAHAGDRTITLQKPVSWKTGDEIVIATTGDRYSQDKNEVKVIINKSSNNMTLTLNDTLQNKHLGEDFAHGDFSVPIRAEVGLLTRNVLIRGNNENHFNDTIEKCPDGYYPGDFLTQTCLQGRFGAEKGTDEFGGHIYVHSVKENETVVRISHIELTYMGQAFRLGRFPIHFHSLGDMSRSYVRNCAIHNSFNRAVNIHGSHNVRIENNVVYNIQGGAFFLEDGLETGNSFQNNLAIFVRPSRKLLEVDVTPAAFWVSNPENDFKHNHVAGGSHFGFLYRMSSHTEGFFRKPIPCPDRLSLGSFLKNVVHSLGRIGLLVSASDNPSRNDGCPIGEFIPSDYDGLVAWDCEKGAQVNKVGAIQMNNFVLINNEVTNIELKMIHSTDKPDKLNSRGPKLINSLLGGGGINEKKTPIGLTLAAGQGLLMENVTFTDFSGSDQVAIRGTHTKGSTNGGSTYLLSKISMTNVAKMMYFPQQYEAVLADTDGSLSGFVGGKIVVDNPTLPDVCFIPEDGRFSGNPEAQGAVCPSDIKFHRLYITEVFPRDLRGKDALLTNQYGTTISKYRQKEITDSSGWMALLLDHQTYSVHFENADHLPIISYKAEFYDFQPGDQLIIRHFMPCAPEGLQVSEGVVKNQSLSPLTGDSLLGDWFYDSKQKMLEYAVTPHLGSSNEMARVGDINVWFKTSNCRKAECLFQGNVYNDAPHTMRPDNAIYLSSLDLYRYFTEDGDLIISEDMWLVINHELPPLNKVFIYGVIEFENQKINGSYLNLTLSATHIIIDGGRLIVGWEYCPFAGRADIVLRGSRSSEEYILPDGPNLDANVIGVFGGLDLHGVSQKVTWSLLAQNAQPDDTVIQVKDDVDWLPGDEIVISTTSLNLAETEIAVIQSVTGSQIHLTRPLKYKHIAVIEDIGPGRNFTMAAEVGLLSHNVRVLGAYYDQMDEESFGAHIVVGTYTTQDSNGKLKTRKGYFRATNVEFYHGGHEGYSKQHDPRYTVVFQDQGDPEPDTLSYVKKCAFHMLYSSALGVYNTNGLVLAENVVYRSVGSSFIITGSDHKIDLNLIVHTVFPGTFNGRDETCFRVDAGIDIQHSQNLVLTDNHVVGSERAGFITGGYPCNARNSSRFERNLVHSSLAGVLVLDTNEIPDCRVVANFSTYRNMEIGVYIQTYASVIVQNITLIDEKVGLFPLITGSQSSKNMSEAKFCEVQDSIIVGRSVSSVCDEISDVKVLGSCEWAQTWDHSTGGRFGLILANFQSGPNHFPRGSWYDITSHQSQIGVFRMKGITFAKFDAACGGREDIAVSANLYNFNAILTSEVSDTKWYHTNDNNKFFFLRPHTVYNSRSVCVTMDCEATKKILVKDQDGTFIGSKGTLIAEPEWQLDGDGHLANEMHIGIYKDNSCQYKTSWQSYVCPDLDYYILKIESLDEDTEVRRISPIEVVGDKYIDLVTDLYEIGWCSRYTCRQRISTFFLVVTSGKQFEIFFSGTSPQHLRFNWLTSDDTQSVLIRIFYDQPWRLDAYANGIYMLPVNVQREPNGQIVEQPSPINNPLPFMPDVNRAPTGSSYLNRLPEEYLLVLRGKDPVEVKTVPKIVVLLEVPNADQFLGNIVENFAEFLGIERRRVRMLDKTSETSKMQSVNTASVSLTITNPPRNATETDPNDLSEWQMIDIASEIATTYQLDRLDDILNTTITRLSLTEPPPPTTSQAWRELTKVRLRTEVTLQIPHHLEVTVEPHVIVEGPASTVSTAVRLVDSDGMHVEQAGSLMDPWIASAWLVSLTDEQDSSLGGSLKQPFIRGWANFTDLTLAHSGKYVLEFHVSYPVGASQFFAVTPHFIVPASPFSGRVIDFPSTVFTAEILSVSIEVVDAFSGTKAHNIGWEGLGFNCHASLYRPEIYRGILQGSLNDVVVDVNTSVAVFNDVSFSHRGQCHIKFMCTSLSYSFAFVSKAITVSTRGYITPVIERSVTVTLVFTGTYDEIVMGEEDYIGSAMYNIISDMFPQVVHSNYTVYQIHGNIMMDFKLSGSLYNVKEVLFLAKMELNQPPVITYNTHTLTAKQEMWVDGVPYTGFDDRKV